MSSDTGPTTLEFRQTARNGEFVGTSIIIWLLNIVTLTLYRFWARTTVRKMIWSRTLLNDEPFEYTGKGSELFKGFLIALAVITIPYLLVVFLAQLLPPLIAAPLVLVLVLAAYWAIGAAIWLSFRYLASRTTWRGIRFTLDGKPTEFSTFYFMQLILTAVTFGWWTPRMDINVPEYLWGHLRYGDIAITYDKTEAALESRYGPFAIGWIFTFFGYFGLVGLLTGSMLASGLDPQNPETMIGFMAVLYAGVFVFLLLAVVIWAPYQAAALRAVVRGLKVGNATFRLNITWTTMAWLTFSNLLLMVFTLGIATPVVQARTARYLISRLESEGTVDLSRAEQAVRGPGQAEGLSDALEIGFV